MISIVSDNYNFSRYNPVIASFEKFKQKFDASVKPPNALVIGGLQMMEGYEYKEGF